VRGRPPRAQRDALDVPERRAPRPPSRQQRLDGVEPDGDLAHRVRVAAGPAATIECRTAVSEGTPVTPTLLPCRSRGLATSAARARRQRALDEREDADDVAALLAREREVVDVEHGVSPRAGRKQQLEPSSTRRHADVEVDASACRSRGALAT
jgi:hypothetical protein